MNFKDHEKFAAFLTLLISLMILATMLYIKPIPDSSSNSGVLQILNMIVGALIGGFGAAVQGLVKAGVDTVKVDNPPSEPIPTTDQSAPIEATGELPEEAKLS